CELGMRGEVDEVTRVHQVVCLFQLRVMSDDESDTVEVRRADEDDREQSRERTMQPPVGASNALEEEGKGVIILEDETNRRRIHADAHAV
ncbi:hypothetical protein PMAYCL1PPCAC_03049, partial [Pristionchus mayeri]